MLCALVIYSNVKKVILVIIRSRREYFQIKIHMKDEHIVSDTSLIQKGRVCDNVQNERGTCLPGVTVNRSAQFPV